MPPSQEEIFPPSQGGKPAAFPGGKLAPCSPRRWPHFPPRPLPSSLRMPPIPSATLGAIAHASALWRVAAGRVVAAATNGVGTPQWRRASGRTRWGRNRYSTYHRHGRRQVRTLAYVEWLRRRPVGGGLTGLGQKWEGGGVGGGGRVGRLQQRQCQGRERCAHTAGTTEEKKKKKSAQRSAADPQYSMAHHRLSHRGRRRSPSSPAAGGGRGAGVGGRGAGAPARWRHDVLLGACWGRAAKTGQQGPVKSRETGTRGLRSVRPRRAFGGAHEGHVRAQQTATPPPPPHPWSGRCATGSPVEASPAPSPRRSQRWGACSPSLRACLWSALWQPRVSLFSRGSFPDQVLRVHASKARTRRRAPSPRGLHPPPPRDAQCAPALAPGCWSISSRLRWPP